MAAREEHVQEGDLDLDQVVIRDDPEALLRDEVAAIEHSVRRIFAKNKGHAGGEKPFWCLSDVVSKATEQRLHVKFEELRTVCEAKEAVRSGTVRYLEGGNRPAEIGKLLSKAEDLLARYSALEDVEAYGVRVPWNYPIRKAYAPILRDFVKFAREYGILSAVSKKRTGTKVQKATETGTLTVGFFGYIGAVTIVIRFDGDKAAVECLDTWGRDDEFDRSKKDLSPEETAMLQALLLMTGSRGDCTSPEAREVLDLGESSVRLELDGKAVMSCRAYGWPPADMDLLTEFVRYVLSTEEKKARMRRYWAEQDE